MRSRPARKLTAALLPLITMGILALSLGTDDWYSVEHIDGKKEEGELWTQYAVDYGILGFQYLEVWSGILGDSYRQVNETYSGEMEETMDYGLVSISILIVLHVPLLVLGFLCALGRMKNVIPVVLLLIIIGGSAVTFYQMDLSLDGSVKEHIEEDLPPTGLELEEDVKGGLISSGEKGNSLYYLIPVPFVSVLSILLFLDYGREKEPSRKRVEEEFFKDQ